MKIINRDTFKHVAISFVLFIFFELTIQSVITSVIIVMALGLLKEIFDHLKKNKNTYSESIEDMFANASGIVMGFFIYKTFLQ